MMNIQIQQPYYQRNNSISYGPINSVPNATINSHNLKVIASPQIVPSSRIIKRVQSPTPISRICINTFI